jgi:two-component system CheB/CheR fusion protein
VAFTRKEQLVLGLAVVATAAIVFADAISGWIPPPLRSTDAVGALVALLVWTCAVLFLRFHRLERQSAGQMKQLADIKHALDQSAIVATTDVSGRITYANDKFCAISQYSRQELLGQDHRIINSGLHPKSFFRDMWQTIARGHVWHGQFRNRAKDGHYYWVDTTIVPFLNDRGKPYQYISIRYDITERKTAEERLREQAALARLGQMAGVVAHEVKNPLAGIKGAIQIMMSRRPPGDPDLTVMGDIIQRIDALNELVQDLLVFSRPRPLRLEPVELRLLLLDTIGALRQDPTGELVQVDIEGPDVSLTGDSPLLRSTFLNLLMNAAQAMGGRGTVRIRLLRMADGCRVEIHDTGPGIPVDLRDRIFEPFFTTKARGGGLGLPIAQRTIELHGGTIAVACPPEGGTLVSLTLPLHPPVTSVEASASAGSPQREEAV